MRLSLNSCMISVESLYESSFSVSSSAMASSKAYIDKRKEIELAIGGSCFQRFAEFEKISHSISVLNFLLHLN